MSYKSNDEFNLEICKRYMYIITQIFNTPSIFPHILLQQWDVTLAHQSKKFIDMTLLY